MSDSDVSVDRKRGPANPVAPVGVFKPYLLRHVGKPCPYCALPMSEKGWHMATRDHILPRVLMTRLYKGLRRKRLQEVNIIIVGAYCNEEKDSLTLMEFLARQRPDSKRASALAVLIESLRAKHPPDVFAALTGSPADF